jgi:FG-GAP-like repeat/Secretion system C-terminal sorting domain/IPT/TIG domain
MKRIAILIFNVYFCTVLSAQTINSLFNQNSFLPKTDVKTGIYPHSVVSADFNQDGKPDLFIARGSSGKVTVLSNTSTNGTISFAPALEFPGMPVDMQGTAAGDLDGDGKPDVAVANGLGDSSVSVYRNTSSGTLISFAVKLDFRTEYGPYSVAIGDLDGDGKPDMAIANNGTNSITIYKNTGTPGTVSFGNRTDLFVGTNPYGIAIGDLDGDGKAELVVSTEGTSNALFVIKNNSVPGNFSFGVPVSFAGLNGAFTLAIGDLDGDGNPDIAATGGYPSAILTIRNISSINNLAFEAPLNFPTGNYMVFVAIKDLDEDGKPELITTNRFTNNISVLKNKGHSGVVDFENHVDYPVGADPFFAAIADLDGDGRPDIITANSASDSISILKNMMGDTLAPEIISFSPASGIPGTTVKIKGKNFTGTSSIQFGGIDAASYIVDSSTGISAVVGRGASGNLTVNTGFGTAIDTGFIFKGPLIYSFNPANGVAGDTIQIRGINFNGVTALSFGGTPASAFIVKSDSSIEAVLGNGATGPVAVSSAIGMDTLTGFKYGGKPTIISFSPLTGPAGSTVIINGNNFNATAGENLVYFGPVQAEVTSASSSQLQVTVPSGTVYDLITVTCNNLTSYSSVPFSVIFSDGDSLINSNSFILAGNYNTGNYPVAVSVADLDQDGRPDLITTNGNANTISVLQNQSNGNKFAFGLNTDLTTGPGPKNIAVGDLNGDGKLDIVISDFNSGNTGYVSIFENTSLNNTISFAPVLNIQTGNGSNGLAIADMDLDGKPDIIVTSGNSGIFSILKNITASGNLSFAPKLDFNNSLFHPDNLTVADMDQDGMPDIIVSDFSNLSIAVFRNKTSGGSISLDLPVIYPVGKNPGFVQAGDLDGDGKPDIAVENYGSGTITFYKNYSTPGSITLGNRIDSMIAASTIHFADLNSDGKTDISIGRYQNGFLSVLQNMNMGAGISLSATIDYKTGNFDVFGNIADLNGDGRPDLMAVNGLLNSVTILKNNSGGPMIISISDSLGSKGKSIDISGKRFTDATMVSFGGTPAASFEIKSSTLIRAVVGEGASGEISVASGLGTGFKTGFLFIPGINYEGSTSICKDKDFVLHSTASSGNQWYRDSIIIDGEAGNTMNVSTSGFYSLKSTSNGITTSADSGVLVTVIKTPAPVISKSQDNILFSDLPDSNQWYFNGTAIPGTTGESCIPTLNGLYTVTHIENGCMSDMSAAIKVDLAENIDLGNGQFARIYPNPVTTDMTIKWNIQNVSSLVISITDLQGKPVIVKNDFQQKGTTINLSGLAPGYYLLRFYEPKSNINKTAKILKAN